MEAGPTPAAHRLRRPITVVGGGAFGLDSRGGALEGHWLALARAVGRRDRPRVCLIPTPST